LPDPSARASSKSSGAIHCVLSHAFLEESPQYHALSYPWQDSTLNVSFDDPEANDSKVTIDGFILLNNQLVEVTPSLWIALWHFRLIAQQWLVQLHTAFWIDALCINQSDIEERAHQVSIMGDIYKNAECVHAWLGLSTKAIVDAM
ncbi:heterokaryon incompatibility protein-domain-containing protein, partial [Leptodontidium sp. 2 PMI_412]